MEMQRSSEVRDAEAIRYGLAILAAVTALFLRRLLAPIFGEENPYHTAWAAVVFSSWYCGVGPSIVAILVDLIGIWYWFLPPTGSLQLANPRAAISGMLSFVILSGCIVLLGENNRRSLVRNRWAEEQLRNSHTELEQKVEERTAELNDANASLRELSGRLQQARDEERRQIARELHDSAGQMLAALSMNLGMAQQQAHKLEAPTARAISDSAVLVEQLTKEVRTISHLLHPPLLDMAGLASALRWYADGFSERSKIEVDLEIPGGLGRLPQEVELAIFRMVQECLTNIHRHSGSDTARIAIWEEGRQLVVQISDNGKGIPLERQPELNSLSRTGVGFRGMRERLRQLGGNLDIRSDPSGTSVMAKLPVQVLSDPCVNQGKAS